MKNSQNIAIVLLLITASILTGLLGACYLGTGQSAIGSAASVKGGDYIMVTGSFNADSDFLYVVDIAANKLSIYFLNPNTNSIVQGNTVDLAKAFGTVGAPG